MQRQFKFQFSRYFAAMLMAAHGVTLASLLPLGLPTWAKAALASLIFFSLAYHLWRASSSSACVALALDGERVVLTTRGGKELEGKVLRDSLVTPFLAVLNVLPQGSRFARSVVVLPDSLDAESFRELRVYLRWGGSHKRQPFA